MVKLNNFQFKERIAPPSDEEVAIEQRRRSQVKNALNKMRANVKSGRLLLDRAFIEDDCRRLKVIDEASFWGKLREAHLYDLLNQEEMDALVQEYKTLSVQRAMMPTGSIRRFAVDYMKFCADLLPQDLRAYEDEMRYSFMNPTVSQTTRDLENYVKAMTAKRHEEEEQLRKSTMLVGSASSSGAIFSTERKKNTCEVVGLDPFTAGEIIKIVRQAGSSSSQLSKDSLKGVFKEIERLGVSPIMGIKEAITTALSLAREEFVAADSFLQFCGALDKKADDTQSEPVKMKLLDWRRYTPDEAEILGDKVFGEASELLDNLLRKNAQDDTTELMNKTMKTSISATGLFKEKRKKVPPPGFMNPREMLAKASNRSDTIVLPNLRAAELKKNEDRGLRNEFDWEKHFTKLGLSGDALSVALERKYRSIKLVKEKAQKSKEKAAEKSKSPKLNDTEAVKESELAALLKAPMYEKGWNKNTGTLVISNK